MDLCLFHQGLGTREQPAKSRRLWTNMASAIPAIGKGLEAISVVNHLAAILNFTVVWLFTVSGLGGSKVHGSQIHQHMWLHFVVCHHASITGVGKCPFLGILNITFKYLLEFISPIVGWCSIGTFTNPCIMQRRPRRVAKLLFTQPSHQSGLDFVNKRVVSPKRNILMWVGIWLWVKTLAP